MKKISSTYLIHQNGLSLYVFKIYFSTLSLKIKTYVVAHSLTTAVPEICCLVWLLNYKNIFFKTIPTFYTESSVGIFLYCPLSSASFRALSPTLWGILGYKPTTSAVTNIAWPAIFRNLRESLKKSSESFV